MSAATDRLRRWREDPVFFVQDQFGVDPDPWQVDVLRAFRANSRIAMKAAKGPGKSAVLAWLIWNFLATRPHPKVAATSITADNLGDNLWTELAKWQGRSEFLKAAFEWRKTRIESRDHPETWWASARTWPRNADPQQQADTLAGLHADYILFVLDESGGIPDAVMASAEAALATGIECHIVQAGNPTHLEGPLYRACTSERNLWHIVEITGDPDDPNRSTRISVQWAREQIEKYGKDNPWVLVNVFGRFPPASINTLLGPDDITAAQRRVYRDTDIAHASKVLGVDVARFGDDSSVVFPRQGLVAFPPLTWRNVDTFQGAGGVARKAIDWKADAIFVDESGGYGAGWIDALGQLGHQPIGVQFAGKPTDARYANKRAEMYFLLAEWVKDRGKLPDGVPELTQALTQITYTFKGDKLILEDKAQFKLRVGMSPDHADALALTFAQPVVPRRASAPVYRPQMAAYDAIEEFRRA